MTSCFSKRRLHRETQHVSLTSKSACKTLLCWISWKWIRNIRIAFLLNVTGAWMWEHKVLWEEWFEFYLIHSCRVRGIFLCTKFLPVSIWWTTNLLVLLPSWCYNSTRTWRIWKHPPMIGGAWLIPLHDFSVNLEKARFWLNNSQNWFGTYALKCSLYSLVCM